MASPIPLVPPVTRARLPSNSVGSNENCLASLPGRPTDIAVPPFLISRVTRRGNTHELHASTLELRILLARPDISGDRRRRTAWVSLTERLHSLLVVIAVLAWRRRGG